MAESSFHGRSFDRIATGYDRANFIMTFGRSCAWLRDAARVALEGCPPNAHGLDVATGTGDFAIELVRRSSDTNVVGLDISAPMTDLARSKLTRYDLEDRIALVHGEALALPFADESFDFVVSSYLLRNVGDPGRAFAEMKRVVKPGGRIVAMDITPGDGGNPIEKLARWHLRNVAPIIGRLVTGQGEAYRYLVESVSNFRSAEDVAAVMKASGLTEVGFKRFALGTMALHWGRKRR